MSSSTDSKHSGLDTFELIVQLIPGSPMREIALHILVLSDDKHLKINCTDTEKNQKRSVFDQ